MEVENNVLMNSRS